MNKDPNQIWRGEKRVVCTCTHCPFLHRDDVELEPVHTTCNENVPTWHLKTCQHGTFFVVTTEIKKHDRSSQIRKYKQLITRIYE